LIFTTNTYNILQSALRLLGKIAGTKGGLQFHRVMEKYSRRWPN